MGSVFASESVSDGQRPGASGQVDRLVTQGGRFGLAARGVVIGIAGGFLIVAALQSDPEEASAFWEEPCKRFFASPSAPGSWA